MRAPTFLPAIVADMAVTSSRGLAHAPGDAAEEIGFALAEQCETYYLAHRQRRMRLEILKQQVEKFKAQALQSKVKRL